MEFKSKFILLCCALIVHW